MWVGFLATAFLPLAACSMDPFQGPAATPTPASSGGANASHHAQIITTTFPTDDLVVASLVATDPPYRADRKGQQDSTNAIEAALMDCYRAGGGVVWLPAGGYRVSSSLYVPPHVTLRGDRRDPDTGSGSYGTVILAVVPSGGETDPGLFRISGSAGVNGLTIFYPNQSISNPVSYPYAFEILGSLLNGDGYMAATVENVTLLNAYRGISAGAGAVHETHRIRNVKGTALLTAMYLQDSADVSRNEDVKFNAGYWSNLDLSLSNVKPAEAQIDAWTRVHATGMRMGGLDWDQFMNLTFSDFNVGVDMAPPRRVGMTASLFGINVRNSHVAFHVIGPDVYPWFGLNIANSVLQANQGPNAVALQIDGDQPQASVLLNNVTLGGGAGTALQVNGNLYVALTNCTFDSWSGPYAVTASRGTVALEGTTFLQPLSAATRGVDLLPGLSSATVLGSKFTGSPSYLLDNASAGAVIREDSGFLFTKAGVTAYSFAAVPHPASRRFFDVKRPPYDAAADGITDDTDAIQHALTHAGQVGGGTVYLPAGTYAVRRHLMVPAGVELRGSDDVPHRAMYLGSAPGTILFAYEGRGTSTPNAAPPLILLDGDRAGVRGLGVHYPEQPTDSQANIVAYPWTIRGTGTGVYAFDIAFSNVYNGIDFSSNASGHYISAINGYALHAGVRVGQSAEGWIEDTTLNINAWQRAQGLPNPLPLNNLFTVAAAYSRAHENAFVITYGALNEHVVNDIVYGADTGFTFEGNAVAKAINIAVDGSVNTVEVSGTGPNGLELVNVQGCGCMLGGTGLRIGGGSVSVFNLLTLERYQEAITISAGSFLVQGAGFHHSSAIISGGTGVLSGACFEDSGTQVTVSGSSTIANLWGNAGQGGFVDAFVNGAQPLFSGNIPR